MLSVIDEFIDSFKRNNLQHCEELLSQQKVNINVTTEDGHHTVLSIACSMDRQDLFDWAIKYGASVNIADPAWHAVNRKNEYMINVLLEQGVDPYKLVMSSAGKISLRIFEENRQMCVERAVQEGIERNSNNLIQLIFLKNNKYMNMGYGYVPDPRYMEKEPAAWHKLFDHNYSDHLAFHMMPKPDQEDILKLHKKSTQVLL